MAADGRLLLAIDTASDEAGVALLEGEGLLGAITWLARQSHSVQLLPACDWLLGHVGHAKHEIEALVVCLGPGSYAGLRVGISTAKALAYALDVPLAGAGRLAAEALPLAEATGRRVVALQAAGRAELACAAYRMREGELQELSAPGLIAADAIAAAVEPGDVITGDIDRLAGATVIALEAKDCRLLAPPPSRVVAVARLGRARIQRGEVDNPDALVPLYLRAPAIGPQR